MNIIYTEFLAKLCIFQKVEGTVPKATGDFNYLNRYCIWARSYLAFLYYIKNNSPLTKLTVISNFLKWNKIERVFRRQQYSQLDPFFTENCNASIIYFELCTLQKPNLDARRHNVYIAGLFPFGKSVKDTETKNVS